MENLWTDRLNRWGVQVIKWATTLIFIFLPFHAFFTVFFASKFGYYEGWRLWKELLVAISFFFLSAWYFSNSKLRREINNDRINRLIGFYAFLQLVIGLVALLAHRVTPTALVFAWIINLRFLLFFIIVRVLVTKIPLIKKYWAYLVLVPASIVVVFGLLQHYVLPNDFLARFGYGPSTIPVYQTIDQKIQYIRLQSTLRGPNPLGAYLILVIIMAITWVVKFRSKWWLKSLLLIGASISLFFTYSRSAWVGLLAGVVILLPLLLSRRYLKVGLLILASSLILVAGLVWVNRENDIIQNTVFHTDEHTRSDETSNDLRITALKTGTRESLQEPLGRGPGTAGPASTHNNGKNRVVDNYYLQISQEIGILGLIVFLLINFYVVLELWKERQVFLNCMLIASFAGITVVNMLSHAWTDDTLAYVWWGLAGLAIGSLPVTLKAKRTKNETAPQTRK